jgi:hypothetical protein
VPARRRKWPATTSIGSKPAKNKRGKVVIIKEPLAGFDLMGVVADDKVINLDRVNDPEHESVVLEIKDDMQSTARKIW